VISTVNLEMSLPDEDHPNIHWSNQLEELIAGEAEKCRGLSWIHQRAEKIANTQNNYIQIPVIILSTLCGTASVSSQTLFGPGNAQVAGIAIGLVSISVGILNTINSYFAFAKRAESHRIAHIQYSKLFSNISLELSLPRQERIIPEILLKQLREQMERLAETTPSPPERVLNAFNDKFKEYKDVAKPCEVNGLQKVLIYRQKSDQDQPSIPTPNYKYSPKANTIQATHKHPSLAKPTQIDIRIPEDVPGLETVA
jgi:hypothetical protein